jgi:hypothetical protein
MRRIGIVVAAALALPVLAAPNAVAATDCSVVRDDFNRADNFNLGPNWVQPALTMGIEGQRATNPNADAALALFQGLTGTAACVDVAVNGTATQYVAIVLGYTNLTDNLFVKVQHNSGDPPGFGLAFFDQGNNGPTFAPSEIFASPFSAARIAVSRTGDLVKLEVDTDFDGTPERTVTRSGVNALSNLGTAVGLGIYGNAFADNFATPKPPSPPSPPGSPPPANPAGPSNSFALGRITRNKRKGTAMIPVTVPGPGSLALAGKGVKVTQAIVSRAATAVGTANLVVRAKGKKKRKLRRTGKVRVSPTISFTPTGGTASSQTVSVKLKRRT